MDVQEIKGQDTPKKDKDIIRESFKGKQLSVADKDAILLQMAKDLGYLK